MSRDPVLRVEPLPPAAAEDAATMATLRDLVNKVYAEAEAGLWLDGATRTSTEELAAMTRAGELVVARLAGALVGCVRQQRLSQELSAFGMLAASAEFRGVGVGRALVRHAEDSCLADGGRLMRLELLAPREWRHPTKEFLASWYTRSGYRLVRVGTLDEDYPSLVPLLATPCDYRIYHKELRAEESTQDS